MRPLSGNGRQSVFRKRILSAPSNGKQWSLHRPRSRQSRIRSGKVSANIVWVRLNTFVLPSRPSKNGFLSSRLKRKAPTSTRTPSHLPCLLTSVPQQPPPATSAPTSSTPLPKRYAAFTATRSPPAYSSPRSEPLSDASCVRGPRSMAPGTVPATSTFARVLTFRRYSGASILAACGQPWNIAGVLGT